MPPHWPKTITRWKNHSANLPRLSSSPQIPICYPYFAILNPILEAHSGLPYPRESGFSQLCLEQRKGLPVASTFFLGWTSPKSLGRLFPSWVLCESAFGLAAYLPISHPSSSQSRSRGLGRFETRLRRPDHLGWYPYLGCFVLVLTWRNRKEVTRRHRPGWGPIWERKSGNFWYDLPARNRGEKGTGHRRLPKILHLLGPIEVGLETNPICMWNHTNTWSREPQRHICEIPACGNKRSTIWMIEHRLTKQKQNPHKMQ